MDLSSSGLNKNSKDFLDSNKNFSFSQLCILLSPEDIYQSFSDTLVNETDTNFASMMVKILSSILLTTTELHELRSRLKTLQTQECADLFITLYKTWCHNPIALVSLCFLSQNYDHACTLVQLL